MKKYLVESIFKMRSLFIREDRLLLVRLDSIGDYVLFRNFIQHLELSKKYGAYKITLCGNSWWKDLAENFDTDYLHDFIWIDYARMNKLSYRLYQYVKLHLRGYHTVIHPTYSRCAVSDAIVLHSGAKIKIGNEGDERNLSATEKSDNDKLYTTLIASYAEKTGFEFYRNRDYFIKLLNEPVDIVRPVINYPVTEENMIVLCPGAKQKKRQWSPINFSHLCNLVGERNKNYKFIICGSENDKALAADIMANSTLSFVDKTGCETLSEFISTVSNASVVVTNDSGPFHIAVALNKKTVCLSNGNNFGRFTPYPPEMKTQSVVFYPAELVEQEMSEEQISYFQNEDSTLDINSIDSKIVFQKIVANGWI